MAQLHFYVPDKFAQEIRKRAEQAHFPIPGGYHQPGNWYPMAGKLLRGNLWWLAR